MSQHSEYSPSRMKRILLCLGSVQQCREVPEKPTSSYAREGTLIHTYMEEVIAQWPNIRTVEICTLNEDHLAAVNDTVDYLLSIEDLWLSGTSVYSELKVKMGQHPEVYGTLDFAAITPKSVHIIDWKFGRGVEVSAKKNTQLMIYLAGFLNMLQKNDPQLHAEVLSLPWYIHIAQPRIGNFQFDEITLDDMAFLDREIEEALRLAEAPNPPLNPGEEQCRWCDAAGVCKAQYARTLELAQKAFAAVADIDTPGSLIDVQSIAELYQKHKEVEEAFRAMKRFLFGIGAQGNPVPLHKFVAGKGSRSWRPEVTIDQIEEVTGLEIDEIYKSEIKSPAQIEKLLDKETKKKLQELIQKNPGELTLVHESDKRPGIANAFSVEAAFGEFADLEDS